MDFGSTFTKAALVDVRAGQLVATAEHRTTVETDVLDGWQACRAQLEEAHPGAASAEVLACSSAGGGLRVAVVGNEELVTAEAGRRVALSSGGRVVHVSSGGLDGAGVDALGGSRPDVVLLTGGTDGGNSEVLLASARALADARWSGPVVVAGNVEAQDVVAGALGAAGTPFVRAENVVPRIGVLSPDSAHRAIREAFLVHVIGGKHLSRSDEFASMVRGATPDLVLTAVELLSGGLGPDLPGVGDVVVVDVGGATTDVYSVVEPLEDDAGPLTDAEGLGREVVARTAANRTVEGDLGLRWSAGSTVEEARAAGFLDEAAVEAARAAARVRQDNPAYLPDDAAAAAFDRQLATMAIGVALRRHCGSRWVDRSGIDLREADLVIGSGGALRHAAEADRHLLDHVSSDGGWQVPEAPRVVVDRDYVLAPAGLLAESHPQAAYRLLRRLG